MLAKAGRALDAALDATVLLSYPRLGYTLRRPFWHAQDLAVDMAGMHILITGGNAGLGYAAAAGLARLGATLHLLARSPERGEQARQRLIAAAADRVHLHVVDVSDLDSVRGFAADFLAAGHPLDVLIHNAGVLLPHRQTSAQGIELTWATNVIGPFLLTALLQPRLIASAPARVIFVSSGGMYTQRLDLSDWAGTRGAFDGVRAYAQTKRAQVILSELWAERLAGQGVSVNAMHPGWADTPGLSVSLPRFHRLLKPALRTPAQGADTLIWLAAAPHLQTETGRFWFDRRARPTHKLARTHSPAGDRALLWQLCCEQSGLTSHPLSFSPRSGGSS
ncbi:MAG: SDR family NAD(P)-dependent oxidoreductase [Caldilineales bacterium]|nr:SDR family NAD(P)-dependent oxidoreductase [Caldilineales bacterium]